MYGGGGVGDALLAFVVEQVLGTLRKWPQSDTWIRHPTLEGSMQWVTLHKSAARGRRWHERNGVGRGRSKKKKKKELRKSLTELDELNAPAGRAVSQLQLRCATGNLESIVKVDFF